MTSRPGPALWLVVIVALATGGPRAQQPARQTFRGGVNLVLVDAYPTKDGRIVEGLTPADLQIFEDGRPQQIETLEFVRVAVNLPESERRDPDGLRDMYAEAANPSNRVFVAYLDTPHVAVDGGVVTRGPVIRALDGIIGRDDLFGVVTPNMRATDLTLGRRAQSVEEQLSRYWTWGQAQRITADLTDIEQDLQMCFHKKVLPDGTVIDWLLAEGPVRRYFDEVVIERRREDRTFTSLENLVDHLGAIRETRSVIFLLSNGWTLVPERRELVDEPFKAPPDSRFGPLRTLGGQPAPGDTLTRRPSPRAGTVGVSVGDAGQIQGCYLELQRLAVLDHPRRFRDLAARAARNNVSIFPVAVGGLAATDAGAAERVLATGAVDQGTVLSRDAGRMTSRVQALRTIAENTGGTAIVNANDIGPRVAGLADGLSSYYLISYAPTNTARDGRYRRIEVRTRVPGVSMYARPGYVARDVLAPASPIAAPDPARLAVEEALGALGRARASGDLTTTAIVDGLEVVVVAEWGGAGVTAVSVDLTAADGTRLPAVSAEAAPGDRSVLVRLPIGLTQGPWRVTTRMAGSRAQQDVVTVSPKPTTFLGEPTVFRATPSPRSPLHAVANLLFSRTERIRVTWPVIDAPEAVTARLLDRQGRGLGAELPAVTVESGGRMTVQVDLVLGPLSDGDYVLEVRAERGAIAERRLQAFRVVR